MFVFNPVQLIEEIKKRPSLYDTVQQVDREEKLVLWKQIGAAIYPDWDSFSKATAYDKVLRLQRKWRSLKDAYNRELRVRKSGVHKEGRTVYRYFKKMAFLGGYDGEVSDEIENEELVTEEHEIDEKVSIIEAEIPVKKPKRRKRRRYQSIESIPAPEVMEMPMFSVDTDHESDSDKLFLLSFLPEMRQLPVNIKMWVRAQIANVMQEAVSSHYNNTTPGTKEKRQRHDSSE